MNLVLFDLDNTLLSGDTDVEWVGFLIEKGALPADAQKRNREMDEQYRSGSASALDYVRFYLSYYPPHPMERLIAWRTEFFAHRIAPLMLPSGRRLIASHGKDLVAMITATNRFLTEPIAAAFGIEHLIATEPEIRDGRFTGDIVGAPCMREGKIARLEKWLAQRGEQLASFGQSWFYSDSINDRPLLERVTHPVVVDADAALREVAQSRGWDSISLR